jgi:hypothetical protein
MAVSEEVSGENPVGLLKQDAAGAVRADVGSDPLNDLLRNPGADQDDVVARLPELRAEFPCAVHETERAADAQDLLERHATLEGVRPLDDPAHARQSQLEQEPEPHAPDPDPHAGRAGDLGEEETLQEDAVHVERD